LVDHTLKVGFTASHKKGIVWKLASKFACCVLGQGTYRDCLYLFSGVCSVLTFWF